MPWKDRGRAKLHRHGPTFPRTWRIYFTAVSDTLIPGSFRGAFRFASTDFHIARCFEFTGVSRFEVTVRRTGRDTGAIVRSLRRPNLLTSFAFRTVEVKGIPGTFPFYQFPDKRQRFCRFGNFLRKRSECFALRIVCF